jgi:hypothetical protein
MTSPTAALLWEIWSRRRQTIAAIGVLTVAGRVIDIVDPSDEPEPLIVMLAMFAFLLLLGVFNYTESRSGRGVGEFPRRLFALPVTSLRLVAVPVIAGIVSIEMLYAMWMGPFARDASVSVPFVATLLAALVVFYLSAIWTLERAGAVRLLVVGMMAFGIFFIGQLPGFPPEPPPWWRSETGLATMVSMLAAFAFLVAWRHVARVRDGGGGSERTRSLFEWIAQAVPARRRAFAGPLAAHFWFEWRTSGMVLPALVAGQLALIILPLSWLRRANAGDSFQLFIFALATPILLAVPVGIAFSKARFWTEDLAVPAFVASRPLSAEDLVAIKIKVAAASAMLSWLVLVVFLAVWLPLWGTPDGLSQFALQMWAFHEHSTAAVYGIAALIVLTGMFLTWRLLISRLWSGLSGRRVMLTWSVFSLGIFVIAAVVLEADTWPGWLFDDPARVAPIAWIAGVAVIAKYWMAAYTWRRVPERYLLAYLPIWLAGTATFLAFGLVLWNILRIYLPMDADRLRSAIVLLALLSVPLARIGQAPSSLTRNRHRA